MTPMASKLTVNPLIATTSSSSLVLVSASRPACAGYGLRDRWRSLDRRGDPNPPAETVGGEFSAADLLQAACPLLFAGNWDQLLAPEMEILGCVHVR